MMKRDDQIENFWNRTSLVLQFVLEPLNQNMDFGLNYITFQFHISLTNNPCPTHFSLLRFSSTHPLIVPSLKPTGGHSLFHPRKFKTSIFYCPFH